MRISKKHRSHENILSAFANIVSELGEKPALYESERCYTFSKLDEISDRIAASIQHLNHDKKLPVAMLFGPSVYRAAGIIGILKSGHPFLPLDVSMPAERSRYIISEASCPILLTDKYCTQHARIIAEKLCRFIHVDQLTDYKIRFTHQLPHAGDHCAIVYTSGSTGAPKGVIHSHESFFHGTMSTLRTMEFTAADRVVLASNPATIGSLSQTISALLSGATSFPFSLQMQSLHELGKLIIEKKITVFSSTPTIFRNLCNTFPETEIFESLRIVRLGGESVLKSDLMLCREHCGNNTIFQVAYGATETSLNSCFSFDPTTTIIDFNGILPIGKAVAGKELLILDENKKPLEGLQTGELFVAGRDIATGYLNQPELNRQKFFELPGSDGVTKRFFRTGDFIMRDKTGLLHYKGRTDNQKKIHGNRIDIGEIESEIKQIPEIQECIVRAAGDEDNARLTAFYSVPEEYVLTESAIRQFLNKKLPSYMVPEKFCRVKNFPVLPGGKIDRNSLHMDAPLPQQPGKSDSKKSGITDGLLGIGAQILSNDNIRPEDNFFLVGGNSLRMLQMLEAIRVNYDIKLSVSTFLEAPTFQGISAAIESRADTTNAGIIQLNKGADGFPMVIIGAGAYVFHLAQAMKTKRPVVAVEPPNHPEVLTWNGNMNDLTIEKMSAVYVQLIEKYIPSQKIILAGYSFFGILAFEAARQLTIMGRDVRAVILLDTIFKLRKHPALERLQKLYPENNKSKKSKSKDLNLKAIEDKLNELKSRKTVIEWEDFKTYAEAIRVFAKEKYTPEPISCPGLLVRVNEQADIPALSKLNADFGWNSYFANQLAIIKFPETHESFISQSNIRRLEKAISAWLLQQPN